RRVVRMNDDPGVELQKIRLRPRPGGLRGGLRQHPPARHGAERATDHQGPRRLQKTPPRRGRIDAPHGLLDGARKGNRPAPLTHAPPSPDVDFDFDLVRAAAFTKAVSPPRATRLIA